VVSIFFFPPLESFSFLILWDGSGPVSRRQKAPFFPLPFHAGLSGLVFVFFFLVNSFVLRWDVFRSTGNGSPSADDESLFPPVFCAPPLG